MQSDFIKIDNTKNYTLSAYVNVESCPTGSFYVGYLYYNKNQKRVGNYPRVKKYDNPTGGWERISKVINSSDLPSGTHYIVLRAYWWTSSTTNFPEGTAYVDQFQLEEGTSLTSFVRNELAQEIWAYNVDNGAWREIHTNGSVGIFSLDGDNNVIYYDDSDHKIKSFDIKESVSASMKTNPITLTRERYEVLRELITKVKSDDAVNINIIGDGDTTEQLTQTLSTQTRPTTEKNRFRKKCKDVQVEVVAPASTNDVEIHHIELEYK